MSYLVVYLPETFQIFYKLDTNEKPPSTNLESNLSYPVQWLTVPNAPNSPPALMFSHISNPIAVVYYL